MTVEIKGQHLRVRVRRPIKRAEYGWDDVGDPGHTVRVAMLNPKTNRWVTQSWVFPVKDVKNRREKTMIELKR